MKWHQNFGGFLLNGYCQLLSGLVRDGRVEASCCGMLWLLLFRLVLETGRLAMSNRATALRRAMLSGVASLSAPRPSAGVRGVSPAEESSMSLFIFRGVLYRLLKAAIGLSGLRLGEPPNASLPDRPPLRVGVDRIAANTPHVSAQVVKFGRQVVKGQDGLQTRRGKVKGVNAQHHPACRRAVALEAEVFASPAGQCSRQHEIRRRSV